MSVESFLFQAGYLTIKKKLLNEFVLGYPNEEVRSSLADMYLDDFYYIEGYTALGNEIWKYIHFKGRSDVVMVFKNKVVVVKFKLAKNSSEVEKKRKKRRRTDKIKRLFF